MCARSHREGRPALARAAVTAAPPHAIPADKSLPLLGALRPVAERVLLEVFRSVYMHLQAAPPSGSAPPRAQEHVGPQRARAGARPRGALTRAAGAGDGDDPAAASPPPAPSVDALLSGAHRQRSYFAQAEVLRSNLQEISEHSAAYAKERAWLRREAERRRRAFERSVKHWQGGTLTTAFQAWAGFVAETRQRTRHLRSVFLRLWDRSALLSAKVFLAWKRFSAEAGAERVARLMTTGS